MKQLNLKQIGSFVKTHGVHGQLTLNLSENISFDSIDEGLIEKEAVFVELDGIPVPFFISENGIRNLNQRTIILKLDDIDDRKANSFIGSNVFIENSKLPNFSDNDFENIDDWIGYSIYDSNLERIGELSEFIKMKGNPLLKLDVNGKELLIPLASDFITKIDHDKEEIHVQLPDGYLDALLQD
jgi:16S rRNA processing protein RimM